jgi:hypothetical protein
MVNIFMFEFYLNCQRQIAIMANPDGIAIAYTQANTLITGVHIL